jgi:hypothetical protein
MMALPATPGRHAGDPARLNGVSIAMTLTAWAEGLPITARPAEV